jgi:hypothetical protein
MTSVGQVPDEYSFRWEAPVDEAFPAVHDAQSAWLSSLESLTAPDRRTHQLIRLVCQVIARSPEGIERHARLAAEVGATWQDVLGSILLTQPSFGVLVAAQAIEPARRGWEAGAPG